MAARLFDRILIVDWSAANSPKTGADSIWIADSAALTINPPTRAAAIAHLRALIEDCLLTSQRALIGFDFAFGYPAGFAAALGLERWSDLWAYLHDRIEDGPENRSNRFNVAAAINRKLGTTSGPFWGHVGKACPDGLNPKRYPSGNRPAWPFPFDYERQAERYAKGASAVFQLAYSGSVGSQALLGIAQLEALRRAYPDQIAIWPFETGFADDLSAPIILAEIYPSSHTVADGPSVLDKRQVEAVLQDCQTWDGSGQLPAKLSGPALPPNIRKDILSEEGWILGL